MPNKEKQDLRNTIVKKFNKGETIFSSEALSSERLKALLEEIGKPVSICSVSRASVKYGIPKSNRVIERERLEITYPEGDWLDYVSINGKNKLGELEVDAIGTELKDGVYFVRGCPLTLYRVPYTTSDNKIATGIPKVEETYFKICDGKINMSDEQVRIFEQIMFASGRVSAHAKQLVMKKTQNSINENNQ